MSAASIDEVNSETRCRTALPAIRGEVGFKLRHAWTHGELCVQDLAQFTLQPLLLFRREVWVCGGQRMSWIMLVTHLHNGHRIVKAHRIETDELSRVFDVGVKIFLRSLAIDRNNFARTPERGNSSFLRIQ